MPKPPEPAVSQKRQTSLAGRLPALVPAEKGFASLGESRPAVFSLLDFYFLILTLIFDGRLVSVKAGVARGGA